MPYEVALDDQALSQQRALPPEAKNTLASVLLELAADPHSGTRYDPRQPPELRTMPFGDWGLLVYMIRERQQRVIVLDLTWAA